MLLFASSYFFMLLITFAPISYGLLYNSLALLKWITRLCMFNDDFYSAQESMQWHEGTYSIPFKLFDKPKIWLEKLLWEDAKEKIDCGVFFLPCWTTLSQDIF